MPYCFLSSFLVITLRNSRARKQENKSYYNSIGFFKIYLGQIAQKSYFIPSLSMLFNDVIL